MGHQERLRNNSTDTLEASFQAMGVVVNYRKGQKELKKIVLHPKSTLARPLIYKLAYSEVLSADPRGKPVSITKPSSLLLFVQLDKFFGNIDRG